MNFPKLILFRLFEYESFDEMLVWLHCPLQLAGGTASMQQLKERLEKDLLEVPFPFWLLTMPSPSFMHVIVFKDSILILSP